MLRSRSALPSSLRSPAPHSEGPPDLLHVSAAQGPDRDFADQGLSPLTARSSLASRPVRFAHLLRFQKVRRTFFMSPQPLLFARRTRFCFVSAGAEPRTSSRLISLLQRFLGESFSLPAQQGPPEGERAGSPRVLRAQKNCARRAKSSGLHGERGARDRERVARPVFKAISSHQGSGARSESKAPDCLN
jgi:hypothetical protein